MVKNQLICFCIRPCKIRKLSFPAFHMLTAKQDAQAITDFLAQIEKRVKPARTVVWDFGKTILIAVAHVFAECVDLQDYLKRCYQIVMSIGYPETPSCFIRLDIRHFVQMICRWPCVKKSLEKGREFTVKSFCYVYKCDNFTETKKTLKALLIVLLSKYIGYPVETEDKLISQKSLEKIDKRIRVEKFEEPAEEKLMIEKKSLETQHGRQLRSPRKRRLRCSRWRRFRRFIRRLRRGTYKR